MKPALVLYFLVFALSFQSSGKNKMEWYAGVIKLNSGEKLAGDINFNVELDIVSFQKDGIIKAFGVSKVESFRIFDPEIEESRNFISLNFPQSSYQNKIFFEILLSGKISILRRYRTFNQFYALKADILTDNFGSYSYFAFSEGKYINLKSFKNNLLPILKEDYEEELNFFLERNNLKPNHTEHQIVIIDYYNFLVEPGRKVLNEGYMISLNSEDGFK